MLEAEAGHREFRSIQKDYPDWGAGTGLSNVAALSNEDLSSSENANMTSRLTAKSLLHAVESSSAAMPEAWARALLPGLL